MTPLSQTHPTLYFRMHKERAGLKEIAFYIEEIQSCTVDIAEHNRIRGEYDDMIRRMPSIEEVERLKRELEGAKHNPTGVHANYWLKEGIAEGERRAMQRVEEQLNKHFDDRANAEEVECGFTACKHYTPYSFSQAEHHRVQLKKEFGFDGNKVSSTEGTEVPSRSEEVKK